MSDPDPEVNFHSRLYDRLSAHLDATPDAPFADVRLEADGTGRRETLVLDGNGIGDLVVEVGRANPRSAEVVEQARAYADANGAEFVATCNANDFFLYDSPSEAPAADCYYLNLRDRPLRELISEIFDAVVHHSVYGELPAQRERERIVGVLRSFHASIWPTLTSLAGRAYANDEQFIEHLETWVRKNDYETLDEETQLELAAKQYAYLLANKVLFYEVVRERTPDPIETASGRQLGSLLPEESDSRLDHHLSERFAEIVTEVGYEPIFTPDSGLFEAFPHNCKTRRALADFVRNVERRSITALDEDPLGEIYEEFIPATERKALGQYYTHPKIAETIVRWAVPEAGTTETNDTAPRILDPASGSGAFTVEAYRRLAGLYPELTHQELIDRLVAVDVNRFPLHLTALNLASQNVRERTDRIHAYNTSFFDLDPETDPLASSRLSTPDEDIDPLGSFDAVVGNPPYIRQENLYPDKEHFREHLETFGPPNATPYYDGDRRLGTKSDAYVYFLTHATQFLREGGRLGFIVPTKWLMTDYGQSLQRFLFDHYALETVVGFGARAFEDALVDTALVLARRCADEHERNTNVTKFVRLKKPIRAERIVDAVEFDEEIPTDDGALVKTRPNYRTVALRQRDLAASESGKLAHYLTVPSTVVRLVEHPKLTRLGEFAEVAYGNKTGANDFFFLDSEDLAEWPIDERFLTPAIKSPRDADSQVVTEETTDRYLLDVYDYVEGVRDSGSFGDGSDPTARVKRALARDGYDALRGYVDHGERQGYHERRTCAAREVWFDLGELLRPEILHPKFFDERVIPMWNRDRLAPSNAVDGIYLDDGVGEEIILALLNSTIHKIVLECWGRTEGGGALQLMTYEMETLPIVDPETLGPGRRTALKDALGKLLEGDDEETAQTELDEIVLDAMDLDLAAAELQEIRKTITERRIRGGDEANVPVERIDEFDEVGSQSFTTRLHEDKDATLGEFAGE